MKRSSLSGGIIPGAARPSAASRQEAKQQHRFSVLTATRGDEGIRLARRYKPDLILLDIMMPGMAGTRVAEELREAPETAAIPIVFLTSVVRREEIGGRDGLFGGHRVIAKPVPIEQLIATIDSVLGEA